MKKFIFATFTMVLFCNLYANEKKSMVPTVYGKIMVTYGMQDVNSEDAWELTSHASRIGVKGKYPITDSLKAVYKMEWEVDVTDKSKSSDDHIKARNQYIGLAGGFGTILFGRHDTPTKKAQGKVDLFNDLDGDIKYMVAGDVRVSNVVAYVSPKLGDTVGFMVAVVPGESPDGDDGPADYISGNVTIKKNGFYAGFGADSDVGGKDILRAVFMYKVKQVQFGGLFEHAEISHGEGDGDAFMINAAYKTGKTRLKVQYGNSDIGPKGKGLTSTSYQGTEVLSAGIDYLIHKKGSFFAYYSTSDDDGEHESDFLKVGGVFKF